MIAKPPQPPKPPFLGRFLFGGVVLLLALIAGHSLLWRWSAGALAEGFTDWVAQRRVEGWTIRHETPERGGWPFTAKLSIPQLQIDAPSDGNWSEGLGWDVAALELAVPLPWPDALRAEAKGAQRLRLGGASIPYQAGRLSMVLPLQAGQAPNRANALLQDLRAETAEGVMTLRQFGLNALWQMQASDTEAALALQFTAEDAALPSAWFTPAALAALGPRIARLEFDGASSGPISPVGGLVQRLDGWRAAGGSITLDQLRLRWGEVDTGLRMALRLDQALQPMATGVLVITNPNATLESLARLGAINRRSLDSAKFALALMTRRPEDGSAPLAELPATYQSGTLTLAQMPLLRLPPIAWPAR